MHTASSCLSPCASSDHQAGSAFSGEAHQDSEIQVVPGCMNCGCSGPDPWLESKGIWYCLSMMTEVLKSLIGALARQLMCVQHFKKPSCLFSFLTVALESNFRLLLLKMYLANFNTCN